MQLPAQLPIRLPRPCYLAGDPVLEIEVLSERKSLIYHHGKQREIDRRMLTDQAPPPRQPPRLHPQNSSEVMKPRALARSMAREDQARENMIWTLVTNEDLREVVEASLKVDAEIPQKILDRLAALEVDAAERAAAGKPPRVKPFHHKKRKPRSAAPEPEPQPEPQPEPVDLEAQRDADLLQRERHLAVADIVLSRVPVNQRIDLMLELLWQHRSAEAFPATAAPTQPPRFHAEQRSAPATEPLGLPQPTCLAVS